MSQRQEPLGWISYWKPKDEWYYLPRDKREELLEQWEEIRQGAITRGAQRVGNYECRANTRWARVSVWEFPGLELLRNMVTELEETSYYYYFAEQNAFGRRTSDPYENYMVAADLTVRG
jgi:hypothetical protein